jgi:hypothetical protein
LSFRFKQPVEFSLPSSPALAIRVSIEFTIDGQWIAQRVEIDATSGLYDWIRRTVRLGPGAGRLVYKDVQFGEGGDTIDCPPGFEAGRPPELREGEIALGIVDIGGLAVPEKTPNLDDLVVSEDRELIRRNLSPAACRS